LYAEGAPPVPELNQLIKPPHKLLNTNKNLTLYLITVGCSFCLWFLNNSRLSPVVMQFNRMGKELMVVTSNPFGYVFFVEKHPVAFKTNHNPMWDELIKKSCEGCE